MRVLLTAPHGKCPPRSTARRCDIVALERMMQLKVELEKRGMECIVMLGTIYREQADLNRYPSRYTTKFRQDVRTILSDKQIDLLLDVHSFPSSDPNWSDYDLVMLKDTAHTKLTAAISRCVGVPVFPGINNDIIDEATRFNVEALLLEFREHPDSSEFPARVAECIKGNWR